MVQISTPWGDPEPGNGPPVRRFLSNYFDLLLNCSDALLSLTHVADTLAGHDVFDSTTVMDSFCPVVVPSGDDAVEMLRGLSVGIPLVCIPSVTICVVITVSYTCTITHKMTSTDGTSSHINCWKVKMINWKQWK